MPTIDIEGSRVHYRDEGEGPPLVLAHSAGGSSGQWRALTGRLAPRRRVLAPDLWGHGRTPPWPGGDAFALDDEAALIEAVIGLADEPVDLIGHSYGGSASLQAAARGAAPVKSLMLIEPTLFALLRDAGDEQGLRDVTEATEPLMAAAEAGDPARGAALFMDYLLGAGTWDGLPAERRESLTRLMETAILRECRAQISADMSLAAYMGVAMPVRILCGTETPLAIAQVSRLLSASLPFAELRWIEGAGHMAPLTHADTVNDEIEAWLKAVA